MACLMLVIGGGVFYGVTLYIKKDASLEKNEPIAVQQFAVPEVESNASSTNTATSAPITASSSDQKPSGKKIAFTEFMRKGGSYKCAVTQTMSTMTTQGTVYMHDDLVRAEFSSSLAGQTINSAMIARDGYMYSWTSAAPSKGIKTKLAPDTETGSTSKPATYTWNGSQVGDYSCEEWKADDSIFEIPKTIVFTQQ